MNTKTVTALINYDETQTAEDSVLDAIEEIVNIHGEGIYSINFLPDSDRKDE